AVAAPGDGKELLGGQGRPCRVEQRAEHRAGLKSRGVEWQRLQDIGREEPVIADFGEDVAEQRGCLAHQCLVRWIVLRDVVAGWRRPVGTLDQKAEEGLLLRREGHHQRGVITLNEPAFAVCGAGQEGDLDLQRRMTEILELTVPDEPFFVLAARPLRQRDAAAGTRAVYRCALRTEPATAAPRTCKRSMFL